MIAFEEHRNRYKRFIFPAVIMAILLYLLFHAMNGNHGIYALFKEQRHAEVLEQKYQAVHAERLAMENRVQLLSDKSLDVDLLDERARIVLGYTNAQEKIHLVEEE